MANLIGQSLGRYHILEQLGEGGMATVYKAYDTRLERDVAVKIIRKTAFSAEILEKVLARFEREAKALAKLSHPNIVKVHDYGDHEGSPYLVLEYLPGGTLRQLLGKPIPWQEALQLLLPIARGLAYAHQRGIIHRDVKPSNILVTESGEPLLSDFGIAKLLEIEEGQTLTGSGVGIGTPEYMAPEQGIGKGVDARADIYSLGIVLYEMVTGRKPYMAETPMAVVLKQMTDPLPRPTDFNREIPPPVEKILLKALAKKPQDRYESMNNFIQAMEICLVGKQSGIKKVSFSMQAKQVDQEKTIDPMIVPPSIVSGKKTLWILATTCIVVVALVGGVLGWQRLALSSQKPTSAPTLEKANAPLLPDQTVITTEKTSLPENARTPSPSTTNIPDGTVLFSEDFEDGFAKISAR
ncbi:MAG: serine/threonine-protein kinase, partial [Chloroflexi bacterium]|nr:serine/threonine-protein kinase [Chloroflexota bacterium]